MASPMKIITVPELAQHAKPGDMWLAIEGEVYNVSKFANLHPGGAKVLEQLAGHDVTTEFHELHRHDVLAKYGRLKVGQMEAQDGAPVLARVPGEISKVPFAEIPGLGGTQYSPYFGLSHKRCLQDLRAFVEKELVPVAATMDLSGEYPGKELQYKLGISGAMIMRMGPGPWMKDAKSYGIRIPGDVPPEEFDYFHEMIGHQEIARLGLPGFVDAMGAGWMISVPAIYHFAKEEVKQAIIPQLFRGEKWSCLAISEPFAGSDVAGLRATATKTPDGKHYIINGVKKWITEGMYSDYFVTAVRTGGAGAGGISLILVERGDGVETSQIKTTYSTAAGTSLVVMSDVKVPVTNLLGEEGKGFKLIMYNFNHERWYIVNNLLGQVRAAIADTFMWAHQRKIFGKRLIDQPVIRNKLASSVAAMEAAQSYNEAITYDMCKAKGGPVGERMAGPIAMLKYQVTRTAWKVADDTVQILGGRGITRTGMGAKIEGLKNFAKYAAVYGGSEEIMADLAIKQALKNFPAHARL